MKIAVLTLGTRGDVQPYAILAQGLHQRGHQVTLSTAQNFESLVQSYGVNFMPIQADYQALLDSEEGKKMMKANPFAVQRNLKKWVFPLVKRSLQVFYQLALTHDKVIYHVKTMADSFADQFPEKMIRAMVVPAVQETRFFPNPAFSGLSLPSFANKMTYRLTELGYQLMKNPVQELLEKPALYQQAREFAEILSQENGLQTAIELIEGH